MSVLKKNLTLVSAAGAALALTAAMSAPALAATKDLTYTCATLGPTATTFDFGSLKSTMVVGQKDKHAMSQVIHLSAGQGALAKSLADSVSGTLDATGASKTLPFAMTIPDTTLNGGAQDVTATGTGTIRPTSVGTWQVKVGDMTANLVLTKNGTDTPFPSSCTAPTDGSQNLGTITVVKDTTTTATTATYSAAKHIATGTAKVKSHFGLKPTGQVKFTLKKGTHVLKSMTDSLNKKGIASVHFKGVKAKGKYTIVGHYKGNSNLKGSTGKDTFTVK